MSSLVNRSQTVKNLIGQTSIELVLVCVFIIVSGWPLLFLVKVDRGKPCNQHNLIGQTSVELILSVLIIVSAWFLLFSVEVN